MRRLLIGVLFVISAFLLMGAVSFDSLGLVVLALLVGFFALGLCFVGMASSRGGGERGRGGDDYDGPDTFFDDGDSSDSSGHHGHGGGSGANDTTHDSGHSGHGGGHDSGSWFDGSDGGGGGSFD